MTAGAGPPVGWIPQVAERSGADWASWLLRSAPGRGSVAMPGGRPGGDDDAGLAAALEDLRHVARRQGFAVEAGDSSAPGGFASWPSRIIGIPRSADPRQAVIALAHQLGHVLLHEPIAKLEPGGIVPCHGLRKVEADSVALLVAEHLGISADEMTFPHMASWAGTDPRADPEKAMRLARDRVLTATSVITAIFDTRARRNRRGPGREAASARTRPTTTGALAAVRTKPDVGQEPIPVTTVGPEELIRVHEAAADFFCRELAGSWVPGYLAKRGFGPEIQEPWRAGYAPKSWDALTRYLRETGYPDEVIEAAGLARRSRRGTLIDTFRDRAVLPIRSPDGTIIAFTGRAPASAATGVPKYLNSPRTAVYDKSETLFGLAEARDALTVGARPVIVEGVFDAIAVTTASPGRYSGVAPCGTALTTRQVAALSRFTRLATLVGFDADAAGQRAAIRAYRLLSGGSGQVMTVRFRPGQDAAQVLADHGPEALAATLTSRIQPLADLVTDAEVSQWVLRLAHAEGRIGALRATAPLIAAMPPCDVARQVARLASRLELDHAMVTEAVTDAVSIRAAARDLPPASQQAAGLAAVGPRPAGRPSPARRGAADRDGLGRGRVAR